MLARVDICVDVWHYRKGHKGCKSGGSRPLPAVNPSNFTDNFPAANTSACEEVFSYVKKLLASGLGMTPDNQIIFLHL
eukprot:2083177-Karenia_brevis.AAC.1